MYAAFLFAAIPTFASEIEDYRAIALEAKRNAPAITAAYQADAKNTSLAAQQLTRPYQADAKRAEAKAHELLNQYAESHGYRTVQKQPPAILIFVSFSMPEQSLIAYLRDAKKVGASVVIRGLIDNSFQKTFHRMAELVKASEGGGVELNPLWFKKFSIKTVPAVVVVEGEHHDVMIGNITLTAALKIIRDSGETNSIAQSALSKLEGESHA
jgi:type-F conjugative transfer system pilin assembly protein TrbC